MKYFKINLLPFSALCVLVLMSFFSCQKEDFSNFENPDKEEFTLSEEDFMAISEGIYEYILDLNYTNPDFKTRVQEYKIHRSQYPEKISLSLDIELQKKYLNIKDKSIQQFYSTLIEYKAVITSPGFSEKYLTMLKEKIGNVNIQDSQTVQSRWFLSTLGGALGLSSCWTGALAVVDTAAYIATGVLTAPTGIGAVANWGGAIASYGYALSTIGSC